MSSTWEGGSGSPSLWQMFYATFSPTSPSSLVKGHRCHCSMYVICPNRAPEEGSCSHLGCTHTRTDPNHPHPLSRSCRIDKITPPWSCSDTTWVPSLFLVCSPSRGVPLQRGRVTANQAFLSQRCGARGCKAIAPPHPRSGHGAVESDGGCHLTASNSTWHTVTHSHARCAA